MQSHFLWKLYSRATKKVSCDIMLRLNNISKNQCPTCRNVVETKDLKTTIVALRNILLKLITFCDNKPNGCAWKAEWSKLEPHLNNCDFSKVSCSFNCGESFLQKEKDEHEAKCNQRPQQCEHCSVNLKACNFPVFSLHMYHYLGTL